MERILGIDLGTNSIGWAVVEREEDRCKLVDKGVNIFQEGVAREKGKGNETPRVQERTNARALRRHYFRRRLRKIKLLKVLIANGLCPYVDDEALQLWRQRKIYPMDEAFLAWQRTDDNIDKNPYHDRNVALNRALDLSDRNDRFLLGRALYHLAQRRGFLSNRKEQTDAAEEGKVKGGIKQLTEEMEAAGCRYLGEYFYRLYGDHEKIRTHYTDRKEHYIAEFEAICAKQHLPSELHDALYDAIFFQRPLKSQKGLVGKCTFEHRKSRCPISHPCFEEFRMWKFINDIRIKGPSDDHYRPLNEEEIRRVLPKFFRKSKPHFDFEEIAKEIAGKGNYGDKDDRREVPYRFSHRMSMTVSGCPTISALRALFGEEEWLSNLASLYTLGSGKNEIQILNDVWHVLFTFEDKEKLKAWGAEKLQLNETDAARFAEIRLPQGYASLSLNVINKVLPYLRDGFRYDEAIYFANLPAVLPADADRQAVVQDLCVALNDCADAIGRNLTKEQCIREVLTTNWRVEFAKLDRLYHPSKDETYQPVRQYDQGELKLGSPRTSSVRNPMAMRALFRLRILINRLLRDGVIDRTTKINIELARELNDANKRKAIELYQQERKKENERFEKEIRELYRTKCGAEIKQLTEDDLLKYRLWKEQKHLCLYTGEEICICDFIGSAPLYDIEHTVPHARGGDNSQINKTLCQWQFNRESKYDKLPSELAKHAEVMARIEQLGWGTKVAYLQKQIDLQIRKSRSATTKEEKDKAIQSRHLLRMKLDYWQGKLTRFTMTEVPEGFSNRQGVDIGIIGRYARRYLLSLFEKVYTVKGATTAEFRKMWGLQDAYTKKSRDNHAHHCIDAVTIACIGRKEYDEWARYQRQEEYYRFGRGERPQMPKPWPTFTEEVLALADELLVPHHTADNMPKQSRKLWRKRGVIQRDSKGNPLYEQGDTARGPLHLQTFYGAIKRDDKVEYVVRKSLGQLKSDDVKKIVDDAVREKVQAAVDRLGFKKAMASTIWMNEEKQIPIKKVRIFTRDTQPIYLKPHRDRSEKAYKRDYHVAKGKHNYCMAVYEGTEKGKPTRSFQIVSNLDAAKFYNGKTARHRLVALSDAKDYPLKWLLKSGTMVLFYKQSPAELKECSQRELAKRLYKITGLEGDGRIQLVFHQEARSSTELSSVCGMGISRFDVENPHPKLRLSCGNLNMCVEGYDFELTVTGEIRFKH